MSIYYDKIYDNIRGSVVGLSIFPLDRFLYSAQMCRDAKDNKLQHFNRLDFF